VHRDVQNVGKAYISMYKSTSRCTDKTFSAHLDAQDDVRWAVRTGNDGESEAGNDDTRCIGGWKAGKTGPVHRWPRKRAKTWPSMSFYASKGCV